MGGEYSQTISKMAFSSEKLAHDDNCILGDSVLEPLANKFGIEVVIYESESE